MCISFFLNKLMPERQKDKITWSDIRRRIGHYGFIEISEVVINRSLFAVGASPTRKEMFFVRERL